MTQQDMIDWFVDRKNEPATLKQVTARFRNAQKLMWRLAREIETLGGHTKHRSYRLKPAFYAELLKERTGRIQA